MLESMTNQRLLCCSDGAAAIAGLANQVLNINESGTVLRKKMLRSAQLDGALARRLCTAGGRVLFTNVLQSVYAQIIDCETCESPARIEVNFMELCAYVIDSFVND